MKQRIVVIDDSSTSRLALSIALKRRGFEVETVGEIDELDFALAKGKPELLVIDIYLRDVFGSDLVPWLREVRHYDRPILLCSNRSADELAALAEECGADGYLRKSGNPDEIADKIQRVLSAKTPP